MPAHSFSFTHNELAGSGNCKNTHAHWSRSPMGLSLRQTGTTGFKSSRCYVIIVNGPARSAVHASYTIANYAKKGRRILPRGPEEMVEAHLVWQRLVSP